MGKKQVCLKCVFNRKSVAGSIYTGGHFPSRVCWADRDIAMLLLTKILALSMSINTIASPLGLHEMIFSWNPVIRQNIKGPWSSCAFITNKEKCIQVAQYVHCPHKDSFLFGEGEALTF